MPTTSDTIDSFLRARSTTEQLVEPLEPEDTVVQAHSLASPVKWHLAHTTWFFETFVLSRHVSGYREFDPRFRDFFNSYYNAVGPQIAQGARGAMSRPTFSECRLYRKHVDDAMATLLGSNAGRSDAVRRLVEVGEHHEQQHQELILTDILAAFAQNPLRPVYRKPESTTSATGNEQHTAEWVEFDGGLVDIGSGHSSFCFDNELPRHQHYLQPFRVRTTLVSNGEYRAFVEDDGYRRPELWLAEGWDYIQREKIASPAYWDVADEGSGARRHEFGLRGLLPLNDATPVCHVSFYEADAFARWAGARLPREAEWEHCVEGLEIEGNLLNSGLLRTRQLSPNAPCGRVHQAFGDTWEWTQSSYCAYPGYRTPPGAIGEYNSKFMAQTMVLRGGSFATPSSHIRATYRNFWAPQTRWQFTGIRLANDRGN